MTALFLIAANLADENNINPDDLNKMFWKAYEDIKKQREKEDGENKNTSNLV